MHHPSVTSHLRRRVSRGHSVVVLVAFVLVSGLLAGCKSGSFLGRRYENFTAYYNTFYNARNKYAEGTEAFERTANQAIDRTVYLPVFYKPERVTNQETFNEAIKKSADVLREHPGSKWVDDALLLIGKSYFYLENYVGAEEKFQEVMTIGGALDDEARFWLARTLIAADAFEDAMNHIAFSLSVEGLDRDWEAQLRLALGELHVRQSAWEEASVELERGLDRVSNDGIAARASFLLGQVYETLERYDQAIAAYASVQRFKPDYTLSYAARVSEIRVQAQQGDPEVALRLVRSMERDDKHFESRAELIYLRGRVYQALREADQAYTIYDGLLYADDPTLNANAIRGKIHYAIGELYRDVYVDFNYAAAHFDTARGAIQTGARRTGNAPSTIQYTPEAITDAEEQALVFGSFRTVHEKLANLDSLMRLGAMDDESFDAFIMELRKKRAEEILEEQRLQARRLAEQQFQQIASVGEQSVKQLDRFAPANQNGLGDSETGFLFHKDRIRLQEGRLNFIARWGDRPRVEHWRRLDAVNSAVVEQQGGTADSVVISARDQLLADMELPQIDYSDVPRDEASRARVEDERAQVRYELANVLFLSMERPDSAAAWYRMVIDETGDLPVAQRAYYALAEVQRALGDSLSAQGLYARVLDLYPDNDFAGRVREHLGMAPADVIEAPDSLALADAAYDRAYSLWSVQQYDRAIEEMLLAASTFPKSDIAPRALLAIGAMYMEWADRDSLDLYALPIPMVPDSVLQFAGFVDSLQVPAPAPAETPEPDTTLAASIPPSPSDSTLQAAPPDSVSASPEGAVEETHLVPSQPADTLARTPEAVSPVVVGADSSAALRPIWAPIRIDKVYTVIVARYPRTSYADVANRRLTAIAELRPEAEVQQIVEEIAEQAVLEALSPQDRMFKGPEPVDLTAEGWVLVVASFADQERASRVMTEYQEKGFRSNVMKAPTRYRVIIGHFPTLDEARAVLAANKESFPTNTWFMDLQKPR